MNYPNQGISILYIFYFDRCLIIKLNFMFWNLYWQQWWSWYIFINDKYSLWALSYLTWTLSVPSPTVFYTPQHLKNRLLWNEGLAIWRRKLGRRGRSSEEWRLILDSEEAEVSPQTIVPSSPSLDRSCRYVINVIFIRFYQSTNGQWPNILSSTMQCLSMFCLWHHLPNWEILQEPITAPSRSPGARKHPKWVKLILHQISLKRAQQWVKKTGNCIWKVLIGSKMWSKFTEHPVKA